MVLAGKYQMVESLLGSLMHASRSVQHVAVPGTPGCYHRILHR